LAPFLAGSPAPPQNRLYAVVPPELKDTFERFTEGPTFVNEVIAGIAPGG